MNKKADLGFTLLSPAGMDGGKGRQN